MATWKKVLVSGSDIDVKSIKSKPIAALGNGTAAGTDKVLIIDATTGVISTVAASGIANSGNAGVSVITSASTKIVIGGSATSPTIDVAPGQINIADLNGTLAINKGGTGATTKTAALTALGGQPVDADLTAIAALAKTNGNIIVGDGNNWIAESGATALTSLGAQPTSSALSDIAGLTSTDGNFIVGDGSNWIAESGATVRTSLGLGDSATQNTNAMNVSSSTIALSVAANSVALGTDTTGNYVADVNAVSNRGIDIGGADGEGVTKTVAINLASLSTETNPRLTRAILTQDLAGTNPLSTTFASMSALTAGSGLTGNSTTGILSVDYGSNANDAVEGNTKFSLTGTAGEIGVTGTTAQDLGAGPSYTLTLPDTITGARTFTGNIAIDGNLTLKSGSSFLEHTENTRVADKFIHLASGSGTTTDGGIFVQQDTNGQGVVMGFDASADRWSITYTDGTEPIDSFTADASLVITRAENNAPSAEGNLEKAGNIFVDTSSNGDIYIYS